MFKNFKLLDSNHILHKEGIIINIQTLEFIYPKSTKNVTLELQLEASIQ